MRKYCCNRAVYIAWLRRYWPGGALMALVFLFAAVGYNNTLAVELNHPAPTQTPLQLAAFICRPTFSSLLAAFTGGCAGVAALLCHSYLCQPGSAAMMHALPVRREGLYASVFAAGLSLLAAPVLFSGVLFGAVGLAHGVFAPYAVLLYLLVMLLCAWFAFSFTSLACMLSGQSAAAGIFAVAALFGPPALEYAAYTFCSRVLFGFTGPAGSGLGLLSAWVNPAQWVSAWLTGLFSALYMGESAPLWPALALLASGASCAAAAVLLYRRRQLERAGDVVAVTPMRPVFRFGMALLGAGLLASVLRLSGMNIPFAMEPAFGIAGGALGYFAAEMLLARSLRVLRRWKGAVAFCLVYALLMGGLYTDVLGYGSRRIAADQVAYITVGNLSNRAYLAMKGGALASYVQLQDLDIQGADAYLEKARQDMAGAMPEAVALQILQQDATVLKGENIAAAVTLQNLLAASSKELVALLRQYEAVGFSQPQVSAYHYSIPLMAKMKDGSLFYRDYTVILPAGAHTDLVAALNEVYRLQAVGGAENALRAAQKADQVTLIFNTYVYPGEKDAWTLNTGEWDGLFEAYLADIKAQTPAPGVPYALGGYSSTSLATCQLVFGQESGDLLELEPCHENTMRWLVAHGLLSEEELAQAKARAADIQAEEESILAGRPAGTQAFTH